MSTELKCYPRAAVIIPVYNGESEIGACLDSVLAQTMDREDYEVIVVDDGSTDRTREIVAGFDVKLITIQHGGPAKARNTGAAETRAEILVFTDADCVPEHDWLERMVAPFEDENVVGSKGVYLTRQSSVAARFAQAEFETRYALLRKCHSIDMVDTYSGAFRRDAFEHAGGFDPNFPVANNEDVDLSYRIAEIGKRMVFVPDARVYHSHPDTWWKYAKVKFLRGYWRMAVYKRFAHKAISDSYTPQALKLQVLLLGAMILSLGLSVFFPGALVAFLLCMAGLVMACVPFFRIAAGYDPRLVPVLPLGLVIRAGAIGAGVFATLFKAPMRDSYEKRFSLQVVGHMLLDLVVLTASFGLAAWLRMNVLADHFEKPVPAGQVPWTWGMCVAVWFLVLFAHKTYASQRGKSLGWHVFNIMRVNVEGLAILTMWYFLIQFHLINRSLIGIFMVVNVGLLSCEKLVLYSMLKKLRAKGLNTKRVLIVGTKVNVLEPLRKIMGSPDTGFHVEGILCPDRKKPGGSLLGVPILGSSDNLEDILHEMAIDEVFFAIPVLSLSELESNLSACLKVGIQGKLICDVFAGMSTHVMAEETLGMPFLSFLPRMHKPMEMFLKNFVDCVASLLFLVLLSPVMLAVGLAIRFTSGGTIFFAQQRMGLNGRIFTMFKFRTMVENAEELRAQAMDRNIMDGPVFKAVDDPRITPVGRWLRKYSLDELPQLFNVLKGEMSLVGPRPLPVYEAREIRGELRRRVSMKPGITGLWQCSGRNLVNFDQWMKLDLEYIDNWSFWLDIKILFKTVAIMVRGTGAL